VVHDNLDTPFQGRNQLIFSGGGQIDVNLLLYLTNTYAFEKFGGRQLPDCPPLVAGLPLFYNSITKKCKKQNRTGKEMFTTGVVREKQRLHHIHQHQGRNQLFISGGGQFSFDDVIVLIQP